MGRFFYEESRRAPSCPGGRDADADADDDDAAIADACALRYVCRVSAHGARDAHDARDRARRSSDDDARRRGWRATAKNRPFAVDCDCDCARVAHTRDANTERDDGVRGGGCAAPTAGDDRRARRSSGEARGGEAGRGGSTGTRDRLVVFKDARQGVCVCEWA